MKKAYKLVSGNEENWQALANAVREGVDINPPKESISRQEILHLTSHVGSMESGPKEKDRKQIFFHFCFKNFSAP